MAESLSMFCSSLRIIGIEASPPLLLDVLFKPAIKPKSGRDVYAGARRDAPLHLTYTAYIGRTAEREPVHYYNAHAIKVSDPKRMKTPLLIVVFAFIGWVAFTHGDLIGVQASTVLGELRGYAATLGSAEAVQITAVQGDTGTVAIWNLPHLALILLGVTGLLWLRRLVRIAVT
ncbi:MAG: hypothetical protein AAF513_14275 [Pseudomonadota bacterium]